MPEEAVEGTGETLLFVVGFAVPLVIFWRLLALGLADVRSEFGARAFTYYRWFAYAVLIFITGFLVVAVVAEVSGYLVQWVPFSSSEASLGGY